MLNDKQRKFANFIFKTILEKERDEYNQLYSEVYEEELSGIFDDLNRDIKLLCSVFESIRVYDIEILLVLYLTSIFTKEQLIETDISYIAGKYYMEFILETGDSEDD